MAVANVPFPSFFLPCPGEPAMPFCTWLRIFENYLRVIDATGDSWPDIRRRAVLLHCLGTEGQRIFYSLPSIGTTYKDAEAALKAYFVPKTNIVAEPSVNTARLLTRQLYNTLLLCVNLWLHVNSVSVLTR